MSWKDRGNSLIQTVLKEYVLHFQNGRFVRQPQVSAFDEGLLYGYGIYETLRAYSGHVFRERDHCTRLALSARQIGLEPPGERFIRNAIRKTVEENRLSDAALRVVLTAGSQNRWGKCERTLFVLAKKAWKENPQYDAVSVPFHRDNAKAKTLNCLTSVLARFEAKKRGAQEAIFTSGANVLEGTTSNVFAVRGNTIFTPEKGVLEGITRDIVICLAGKMGFQVVQEDLPLKSLLNADEAFLTGTLKEIVPLVELDGHPLKTGPVTARLKREFSRLVQSEIQGKR